MPETPGNDRTDRTDRSEQVAQMQRSDQDGTGEPAPTAATRSGVRVPDVYVILVVFSAIAAVATHLVPAGVFDRIELPSGREAIDPDSFRYVEADPVGIVGFLTAIPRGFIDASDVIVFTFVIGGLFMVLRATGLIEIGVDRLGRSVARRSILVIPVLMVTFSVIATIIGTQELSLVYIPVIMPLLIALRFDSVTAAAVALCATSAGFAAGALNPINTGLGQQIAGLPTFSGVELRAVLWLCLTAAAIAHVTVYARRVRMDPTRSLVHDDPTEVAKREEFLAPGAGATSTDRRLTPRLTAGLVVLAGFGAVLVWGVLTQGWFFIEMAGLFIAAAATVGLVSGLSAQQIVDAFNRGMRDVLVGAIIVGVARSVAVVLEDGQIMDTVVNALGVLVSGLPAALAAVGMFVVQSLFNFLVPSGSGQALVTMPIMAPLSDLVGVTRQTAVLAYQLGDGFSNILYPTSGYFMAAIALAGVRYDRWIRFFLPLFASWCAIGIVFLVVAQLIGWTG